MGGNLVELDPIFSRITPFVTHFMIWGSNDS